MLPPRTDAGETGFAPPQHPCSPPVCTDRNLEPQFATSTRPRCTKMATMAAAPSQPHTSASERTLEHRKVLPPALLTYTPGIHGYGQQALTPSPASTESLLSHSFRDQAYSPAGPVESSHADFPPHGATGPDQSFNAADLYLKLSTLLEKGLASTAAKITGDIKADLQIIGSRMDAIECKLDQTAAVSHQNSYLIEILHDQLDTAFSHTGPEDTISESEVYLNQFSMLRWPLKTL